MKNFAKLVGYTAATFAIILLIFWAFETMLGHDIALGLSQDIFYALIIVVVLAILAFIAAMF